ncbi:hypothetical protein [Paenibacillus massiliensis]|uniref:hypothetical protein n=1 Tax=Paenibacillus massiliensis TaxID=225917 RepID=UPI0004728FC8|nr:hypothetical protein [Paenibacillus massiliensis]
MNLKRLLLFSTLALALALGETQGSTAQAKTAEPLTDASTTVSASRDLVQILKLRSDEELYYELYDGKTLADIADRQGADVQQVIDHQVNGLAEQLKQRLHNGEITQEQYEAHMQELQEVITNSVYGL